MRNHILRILQIKPCSDVVIFSVDKGNATVIMYKSEHSAKIDISLQDVLDTTLSREATLKIEREISSLIENCWHFVAKSKQYNFKSISMGFRKSSRTIFLLD